MVNEVTAAQVDGQLAIGGSLLENLELNNHLVWCAGILGRVMMQSMMARCMWWSFILVVGR